MRRSPHDSLLEIAKYNKQGFLISHEYTSSRGTFSNDYSYSRNSKRRLVIRKVLKLKGNIIEVDYYFFGRKRLLDSVKKQRHDFQYEGQRDSLNYYLVYDSLSRIKESRFESLKYKRMGMPYEFITERIVYDTVSYPYVPPINITGYKLIRQSALARIKEMDFVSKSYDEINNRQVYHWKRGDVNYYNTVTSDLKNRHYLIFNNPLKEFSECFFIKDERICHTYEYSTRNIKDVAMIYISNGKKHIVLTTKDELYSNSSSIEILNAAQNTPTEGQFIIYKTARY